MCTCQYLVDDTRGCMLHDLIRASHIAEDEDKLEMWGLPCIYYSSDLRAGLLGTASRYNDTTMSEIPK